MRLNANYQQYVHKMAIKLYIIHNLNNVCDFLCISDATYPLSKRAEINKEFKSDSFSTGRWVGPIE